MHAATGRWSLVGGIFGAGLVLAGVLDTNGADAEPASIHVRDLVRRIRVIGELGVPVDQVVKIRGVWEYSDEDRELLKKGLMKKQPIRPQLRVLEVNGKPLQEPVEFRDWLVINVSWMDDIEANDGETWEMTGVEQCGMRGNSAETTRALHRIRAENRAPQRALLDTGLHGTFASEFHYVSARRIK